MASWTLRVPHLSDIVICDVRGMAVQAHGLRRVDAEDAALLSRRRRPCAAHAPAEEWFGAHVRQPPARKRATDQLSLAAAFSRARVQRRADSHGVERAESPMRCGSVEREKEVADADATKERAAVVVVVDESGKKAMPFMSHADGGRSARRQVVRRDAASLGVGGAPSTTSYLNDTESTNCDTDAEEVDVHAMLWSLWRDEGRCDEERFLTRWRVCCRVACAQRDYAAVRALLRCAALKLIDGHVAVRRAGVVGKVEEENEDEQEKAAALSRGATMDGLYEFACSMLPVPMIWQ